VDRRILATVAVFTFCSARALACGCDPGSLTFQDAFFRYCDDARAAHEAAVSVAMGGTVQASDGARPEQPASSSATLQDQGRHSA